MQSPFKGNERATASESQTTEWAPQEAVIEGADECCLPTVPVSDDGDECGGTPSQELIDLIRCKGVAGGEADAVDIG
jgi:hypothetical protein